MFSFILNFPTVNNVGQTARLREGNAIYSETRPTESAQVFLDLRRAIATTSLSSFENRRLLSDMERNNTNDRIGSLMLMKGACGEKVKRISARITSGQKRLKINIRDI